MNEPLISVVIPAYNAEKSLGRALQSVFSQTYTNIEVIVIDDGSTDGTAECIRLFDQPLISHLQVNSGAAAARNFGVGLTSGRYIAFLDADDMWHPQKLELQIIAFLNNPSAGLCSTTLINVSERDAKKSSKKYIPAPVDILVENNFNKIFFNPYFGTPSVLIKKEDFVAVGGLDENLKTAEDVDLWLRLSFEKGAVMVNAGLTYVIGQPHSLSRTSNNQTFKDNLKVIDKFCKEHSNFYSENTKLVKQTKARVLTEWGSAILLSDPKGASCLLLRALKYKISFRAGYLLSKTIFYRIKKL